jgi:photosystem II stability/assembly factor-like uncharacterized protein
MKKAFLTILCFSVAGITAQAQWTKISAGTGLRLNKVFFPSKNVGYIVPFNGLLRRTLDGGKTWDSLSSMEFTTGSSYSVNDIFFLNDSVGFITTLEHGRPVVYKTTDMGSTNTWKDITPDDTLYSVPQVKFLDENVGYLFSSSGWDGQLYKTTDGGKTWTDLAIKTSLGSGTAAIPAMFFADENTGYLIGGDGTFEYKGKIARTTDGGQNWEVTYFGTNSVIRDIHFPNRDTGYILGGMLTNEMVYRTTDAGATWQAPSPHTADLSWDKIFFIDGRTGFALSSSTIYKTTDAGANWTPQDPGTSIPMNDIFFTDKNNGFIVGDSGLVLKTENGGTSGFKNAITGKQPSIFPNPSRGIFNFRIDEPDAEMIEISDAMGHVILSEKAMSSVRIDLGMQPTGIYYYRITGKAISTGKLVKN